jgi:site-specific DNA recombinase
MKVALYARVATQRQGDKGATLQIEALRAHASKRRFDVVETYVCCDAGYSGASLDRPGLNRLRYGAATKAFDAVVIMSPDRLSRDSGDLIRTTEEFDRCAVPIMFVEEDFKVPLPYEVAAIRGQANQDDLSDSRRDHHGG